MRLIFGYLFMIFGYVLVVRGQHTPAILAFVAAFYHFIINFIDEKSRMK